MAETEKTGLKMVRDEVEKPQKKKDISDVEAWDFSGEDDTYYVTPAKSKLDRQAKENRVVLLSEVILKGLDILVDIAVILEIIVLSVICMQESSAIFYHLMDFKCLWIGVAVVLVADAVFVNLFFEKHLNLILVALVLPFLYPAMRSACVSHKNGFGIGLSFLYFLSICFAAGCVWTAYMNYGDLLIMEDRGLQAQVIICMDWQLENGDTLGQFIKDEFDNVEITLKKDKQFNYVCVNGSGSVYLQDDGFVTRMTRDVPTTLVFQMQEGTLRLFSVTLKEVELTDVGVKNYWNWVASY